MPGWEHFVRRFMDVGLKFYITGSNASLLSRELGTRLTGRYVPVELLENLVFLALRRRTSDVHYYTSPAGYEVDFYLPQTGELIQVSQSLAQPATREREVRALTDALRGLGLTHGLLLTDTNAAPIETDGCTVEVRSLAEWLLQERTP